LHVDTKRDNITDDVWVSRTKGTWPFISSGNPVAQQWKNFHFLYISIAVLFGIATQVSGLLDISPQGFRNSKM
jgi:hypothetical protein